MFEDFSSCIRRRKCPLGIALLIVLTGMAYSLFWGPLFRHGSFWITPGDLWGTYRAAHYIGWGDISDIYQPSTSLIVFPGIAVLLAPIAMLTGALNLTESFPFNLPHPTSWLILGPIEMLLGALIVLPVDALAEELGVSRRNRMALTCATGIVVWPLVVFWGHPELLVALTLGIYALLSASKGQTRRCGWLLGAAIAFQPVALLFLPIILATTQTGSRIRTLVRSGLPSLGLLAIPLLESWTDTTYDLIHQPAFPAVNHPTPLLRFTPRLSSFGRVTLQRIEWVQRKGRGHFVLATMKTHAGTVVSPGFVRSIALVISLGLGLWAYRARPNLKGLTWLCGAALASWCLVEPVMTPYYVAPALVLILICSADRGWRLFGCTACGVFLTIWSAWFFQPWIYWAPIVGVLGIALVLARPRVLHAYAPHPALAEVVVADRTRVSAAVG
jgi:hypothetical protein